MHNPPGRTDSVEQPGSMGDAPQVGLRIERWIEALLFLGLWLACGVFQQGGGWNQNVRFAQVRALVEEGRLDVDDFLVYASRVPAGSDWLLQRAPLTNGAFRIGARQFSLGWQSEGGALSPVVGTATADARIVAAGQAGASGDLSSSGGHLFPNKAPGVLAVASPPYLAIRRVETWLGLSPDRLWILTVNAWLTTALSIGFWAALGGVAFFRLSRRLLGATRMEALASTVAFGLGTLYWPSGTLLQEQDLAAAGLVMAALLLLPRAPSAWGALGAGLLCAVAVAASYVTVLCVGCLGVFVLLRRRRALMFGLGLAVGLLPLLLYHWHCFGGPFVSAYAGEDPAFRTAGALLGVLEAPRIERLAALLASPFRGLFFNSPVLLAGLGGAILAWRRRDLRWEVVVCLTIVGSLVLFNVSFNGWHGGWTTGPRYLVPAIPFIALWWPLAWRRWRFTVGSLSALSIAIHILITGVDVQPPLGVGDPTLPLWRRSPVVEHVLPLFLGRRPEGGLAAYFVEPISSNPVGAYEGWFGRLFEVGSPESRWNAFNAGELLLPGSRWSLLVVALVVAGPLAGAFLLSRLRDRGTTGPPEGTWMRPS
jgi:hypothetical protein